jgi:hypothetical protein
VSKHLVLVVGVGRSGTSLLSGILGQLGFHIPQPEVQADDTNPRGFGEPRWVVDFHSRVLAEQRVTLNDSRPAAWTKMAEAAPAVRDELHAWLNGQLGEADDIVVKDPRTVWFLDLWRKTASELGARTSFVTMLRHPAEIVASARKSYGPGLTEAGRAAAWINVTLQTEQMTRDARRAFVRYDDLLADWLPEVKRLGSQLDVPALAATERVPEVDAFVDPTLHRNRTTWDDLDVPARVRDLAEEVWETIQAQDTAGLDTAREAYVRLYGEAEAIAQCSVMAARAVPRKKAAAKPRARKPAPPPSLRVRIARRIPAPYRRRLRRAVGKLRS